MTLSTAKFFADSADATQKVFASKAITLADGEWIYLDARGYANFTIITGAGATATVARVDNDGDAATTGTENVFTVAANTRTVTPVDWAWYRIVVAGGSCRKTRPI